MASLIDSVLRRFKNLMKPVRDGVVHNMATGFREKYLTEDDSLVLLHVACLSGNLDMVKSLCNTGNIETCDKYSFRPIHVACISGHLGIVEYLHQHGCDIEAPGNSGNRPLHLASKHGRLNVVKYLCNQQCQLDAPNYYSQMPIHFACRFGHTEIVRHLCEQGCDKEVCTNRGERPLHLACIHGHLEIVRILCKHKCDIEVSTSDYTPLHLACLNGHMESVKFLFQQNCDTQVTISNSVRPIHLACLNGRLDIVRFLCEQNCDIEASTWHDYRPIHVACIRGKLQTVRLLCEWKCDIEAVTSDNYTALHLASENGFLGIVEYLCQQKCNIEAHTMFEYRPIHVAVLNGDIDIVRYLCQQRCDLEAVTKKGESVFDLAIRYGLHEIHKLLFDNSPKRQLIEKISNMKVECDVPCDHSSCFQGIYSTKFLIGRGAFGGVFKIKDRRLDYTFCMKSIYLDPSASNQETKHIEFNINKYLNILNHKRIVQYFGMINVDAKMLIFMEYVEGISLDKSINKKSLPHHKIFQYSKEILEGLKFLHQNNIIHRDIKPQNIMLNAEEHVKLCDFGLSCYLESVGQRSQIHTADSSSNMTFCGTANYMAPELVLGHKYSYPVDIWGLGASVVEMLTGVRPFHRMGQVPIILYISSIQKIEFVPSQPMSEGMSEYCAIIFHMEPKQNVKQKIEFVPSEPMSEDMKSLVAQMLCLCPSTRATAEKLLEFINKLLRSRNPVHQRRLN